MPSKTHPSRPQERHRCQTQTLHSSTCTHVRRRTSIHDDASGVDEKSKQTLCNVFSPTLMT